MRAASNGTFTPEGYTVGKSTNTRGPKVWIVNLCGKRIATFYSRHDAVDFAFEHAKTCPRVTLRVDEQGVDEETSARLRAHREEAGARRG